MPTGPKQTLVLPTAQQHTVDKYGRHRAMIISSSGSTQKPATHRRHLLEYSAKQAGYRSKAAYLFTNNNDCACSPHARGTTHASQKNHKTRSSILGNSWSCSYCLHT